MKLLRVLRTTVLLLLTLGLCLHFLAGSIAGQDKEKIGGSRIKPPVVLHEEKPRYTEEARQAGIEGIVLLQLVVRKDGTANSFKVIRGLGYGMEEAAINAIANKWRFKPGTFNGDPADVQIFMEVIYSLFSREEKAAMMGKYPLRVNILQIDWTTNNAGDSVGKGYGNVREGESHRGFVFTSTCDERFNATRGYSDVPANWKESGSRLEIITASTGDSRKTRSCEMSVTMLDQIYMYRDGRLINGTPQQWDEMENIRKKLGRSVHPGTTNPDYYPLEIALVNVSWETNALGGYTGQGRGNIRDGNKTTAFDFSTLCSYRLQANLEGAFYKGYWEKEKTQLRVLGTGLRGARSAVECELDIKIQSGSTY